MCHTTSPHRLVAPVKLRNIEWIFCHLNLGSHKLNLVSGPPKSGLLFLVAAYTHFIGLHHCFQPWGCVRYIWRERRLCFQARHHVLAKQNRKIAGESLREFFGELPPSVNTSVLFCVFCWFFFLCYIRNKQIAPPAAWRDHYVRCAGVNWAMSLSGCGIPVLKLWICLLQLLSLNALIWLRERDRDWIGCWQAADGRWNGREHVGFLPALVPRDAIPGNCKQKTWPALSGGFGFCIWSGSIYYFPVPCGSAYTYLKCSPVPVSGP